METFSLNLGTIILAVILIVAVFFAIKTVRDNKKKGKSCGGDCSFCNNRDCSNRKE